MSTVLTSWKEIAAYLGKGVRTVQRWELQLALPVRRPKSAKKQVIIAIPEEIDEWVKLQTAERPADQVELRALRARVEELEAENRELRQQLHADVVPGRVATLGGLRGHAGTGQHAIREMRSRAGSRCQSPGQQ